MYYLFMLSKYWGNNGQRWARNKLLYFKNPCQKSYIFFTEMQQNKTHAKEGPHFSFIFRHFLSNLYLSALIQNTLLKLVDAL